MNLYEILDERQIRNVIAPENKMYLAEIEIFESIASTNSYLLEQAKNGAPSGFACFAEQQTKGRGRLERKWHSPLGKNIYFSLLWRFDQSKNDLSGLGVAVAVMVANVLQKYGIKAGIQLKWPNDVLIAQKKLAGILLERTDKTAVVIGIGLNLDISDLEEKNWIGLSEVTGQVVARNLLAGLLLNELLAKLPVYAAEGLQPFHAEWQKFDMLQNKNVSVLMPSGAVTGIMRGINAQGEMLLQMDNGEIRAFCYGEVSVREQ